MRFQPLTIPGILAFVLFGAPADAQRIAVGAAYDLSSTSSAGWQSPRGFGFTIEVPRLVRRFGFRASYRDLSRVEAAGCVVTCPAVEYRDRYSLSSLGIGLTFAAVETSWFDLVLGVNASDFLRRSEVERLDPSGLWLSSPPVSVSGLGFGPEATIRIRPVALGLRPTVYVRHDRIPGEDRCMADSSCFPDWNVTSLGLGLSWSR